jgi:hypothetical protein
MLHSIFRNRNPSLILYTSHYLPKARAVRKAKRLWWSFQTVSGFDGVLAESLFREFHACFLSVSAPRSCTRDEGRSLGAGLQEQVSNHLKLLWSNARVVSVKEKAP